MEVLYSFPPFYFWLSYLLSIWRFDFEFWYNDQVGLMLAGMGASADVFRMVSYNMFNTQTLHGFGHLTLRFRVQIQMFEPYMAEGEGSDGKLLYP